MHTKKEKLIRLILKKKALKFGHFILKSGRNSPYFFNSNCLYNGSDLFKIGKLYSEMIQSTKIHTDVIFGLAYKGIPLATATVIALQKKYNINIPCFFNRKELKKHSDSGYIIGKNYTKKNIILIDDVITSGITIQNSNIIINILNNKNYISGIFCLFDRQELGISKIYTAKQELMKKYSCPVHSIINMIDIIQYLNKYNIYQNHLKNIIKYYQKYKPLNDINI